MTTVAQVLQDKPQQAVYTIAPDATVLEAISGKAGTNAFAVVVACTAVGALVAGRVAHWIVCTAHENTSARV